MNLASQINNSASCISTALVPNSHFFDLAWQIHGEEKARFCIYLIICQMEYRLRPASTVFCSIRGTHVKVMGRIKNLSLNSFVCIATWTLHLASLPAFCLLSSVLRLPFCTPLVLFLHPLSGLACESITGCACVTLQSKQWDCPCHWVVVTACVQTQEAQADVMYMLLLVFVYCRFRGTGTWVTVSLRAPWSTKSRQKICTAMLNYLNPNCKVSNNTVSILCVVFIAKE